jgi:hypothetical protein
MVDLVKSLTKNQARPVVRIPEKKVKTKAKLLEHY